MGSEKKLIKKQKKLKPDKIKNGGVKIKQENRAKSGEWKRPPAIAKKASDASINSYENINLIAQMKL